ncbi:MAG: hypothetical protein H0X37_17150 [Herpetosiphonaceae bacterium]|nr:hypothetical protein [Herpetosiphonaceae bacterium]
MIYIFGHSPSSNPGEFATKAHALDYLRHELPQTNHFRYRMTININNLNSILFAFDGVLLAELVSQDKFKPSPEDVKEYPKARATYLIDEIRIFQDKNLRASDMGLTRYQFGREVPQDVYERILEKVGVEEVITNL